MTKQIVIKLNSKKFKPILDSLKDKCGNTSKSDSEHVGKCLYFLNRLVNKPNPCFSGLTSLDYLLKVQGITFEKVYMNFLKEYADFLKD